jgi:Replication protein
VPCVVSRAERDSRAERAREIVGILSVPGPAWTCSEGEYLSHLAQIGHFLGTFGGGSWAREEGAEYERQSKRADRFERQRDLSPLYPDRRRRDGTLHNPMRACRRRRFDVDGAQVVVDVAGKARFGGVFSCSCRSGCEHCGQRLLSRDAELIEALVSDHGYERTLMLTLTVRHWKRLRLKPLRQGLSESFDAMLSHRQWRRWKKAAGGVELVRSLEVPWGEHGYHPHLHVLLLLKAERSEVEVEALGSWISELWRGSVERTMGQAYRPTLGHGAHLTQCHRADYLSKLGLEISDAGHSKSGRGRTYWQLARDWIARGKRLNDPLVPVLREFLDDMAGAKIVTWAPGLKKRAEELCPREKVAERETAFVSAQRWDRVRDLVDENGRDVRARMLQEAERAGVGLVQVLVDAVVDAALARAGPSMAPRWTRAGPQDGPISVAQRFAVA